MIVMPDQDRALFEGRIWPFVSHAMTADLNAVTALPVPDALGSIAPRRRGRVPAQPALAASGAPCRAEAPFTSQRTSVWS